MTIIRKQSNVALDITSIRSVYCLRDDWMAASKNYSQFSDFAGIFLNRREQKARKKQETKKNTATIYFDTILISRLVTP